jgi:hypothetical protein
MNNSEDVIRAYALNCPADNPGHGRLIAGFSSGAIQQLPQYKRGSLEH